MRRREFLTGLGGAAVLSLAARAQRAVIPVIGFLARGPNGPNRWGAAFNQGLKEAGYVEGQNVAIEYHGAPPRFDRMLELANELVRRQVAVILTSNDGLALAAKRATSTIPIVFFNIGSDPVKLGLVASINRPGGNVTGASFDTPQLAAKRLDLLCQLVPTAATVAYLTQGPRLLSFEEEKNSLVAAAGALGRQLIIVECHTGDELMRSFATVVERGAGAATIANMPLFGGNAEALVSFAAQYKIPTIYPGRGFVLQGGLISYDGDFADEIRMAAGLVGEILNGAMPADLPVRKSTKFDLVINLKTAKQLGLKVPQNLLAFADEVIE
jgi:putative ABC transport system substrate-binding protein